MSLDKTKGGGTEGAWGQSNIPWEHTQFPGGVTLSNGSLWLLPQVLAELDFDLSILFYIPLLFLQLIMRVSPFLCFNKAMKRGDTKLTKIVQKKEI